MLTMNISLSHPHTGKVKTLPHVSMQSLYQNYNIEKTTPYGRLLQKLSK